MEFKALNAPLFTIEAVTKLGDCLINLSGVHFTADPKNGQFPVIFDKTDLSLRSLAQMLEKIGCPIQRISLLTFR